MGGQGPIPWTAINDYAIREGYTRQEYERFLKIIEGLDEVYLSHQAQKAKMRGGRK